jgi:hypothetical protein
MTVVHTALAIALLATTSVLLAASLRIAGRAAFALAAGLLAAAAVVGLSILLSIANLLTPAGVLVGEAIVAVAAAGLWRRLGSPRPPSLPRPKPGEAWAAARRHPPLVILIVAAAVAVCLQAVLAVAVAPNESDALAYHLPRSAYWLLHHSALQYQPGQLDDPELAAPPNAELLLTWTMAVSGGDRLTQLVQWATLGATALTIFAIARLLGFRRPGALWAAAIFVLLPAPLLQGATDQNDLLVAFFLLAGGYFAVRGLREGRMAEVALGAVGAGLATGTKLTAALALPAALLILGAVLWSRPAARRLVGPGLLALVSALAAFAAFNYVQNVLHTNTLTGFSGTPVGDFVRSDPLHDLARVGWNLLDAPGLPVPGWLQNAADPLARKLFHGVHGSGFSVPDPPIRTDVLEDESAYGPVGLLVLVPLVGAALLARRRPAGERLIAGGALLYGLACALALGYTPEGARYLMPAAALAAPLLARTARGPRAWAVLALALSTVPATLLTNTDKPVRPDLVGRSILDMDRLSQQTIDPTLRSIAAPVRRLNRIVGPTAPIGFVRQDDFFDYLLFDPGLRRRVLPVERDEVTPARLRADRVVGFFVAYSDRAPCQVDGCRRWPRGMRAIPLGATSYLVSARGSIGAPEGSIGARAGKTRVNGT